MSLFITSLASGSNGNCYYVGNNSEAILIDAGISCRELEKRIKRLALSIHKIKAVFVSHEHSDHIYGIPALAKKYNLPIYITPATAEHGRLDIDKNIIKPFTGNEPVSIGNLTITAFPKWHDAADPYSFVVECKGLKVGVFTDIGLPCEHLIRHFSECHAAFLEANYDEQMLDKGSYPIYLKNRIRGGKGHLSNKQALELFVKHKPPFMSHLLLAHLSKNNNSPELVQELFNRHADGTKIIIASRFEETAVYLINHSNNSFSDSKPKAFKPTQLQFSFE